MARVYFKYRSKKENANLSLRLIQGKQIDYTVSTPVKSKRSLWFTTKGKHKQLINLNAGDEDGKTLKNDLIALQDYVVGAYLKDSNAGVAITKEWLKRVVSENDYIKNIKDTKEKINIAAAAEAEIQNINLLSHAVEQMFKVKYKTNPNELKKYKVTHGLLEKYEKFENKQFKIKDLNQNFADNFKNWALLDMQYSKSYINTQLKRLRSSAVRAYENDENDVIQVSKTLRSFKMFKDVYKDKIVITLNYNELDKIEKTEVPQHLMDAKKAILLGCETGLRYSDMNKLIDRNIKNIKGVNYWEFRTEKTDAIVQITISDRIYQLIEKYGLPVTNYPSNGVKLNRDIKEVCRLAEIKEQIKGSKATAVKIGNKNEKRNITKKRPKYKLISTRTFRRSFATNYYGKIDTSLITAITGHKTEQMLRAYLQAGDDSNISNTKKQIDKFHKKRKKAKNNIKLTVIPKASNQN